MISNQFSGFGSEENLKENLEENEQPCAVFTSQPVSLAMAYVPWQLWRDLYDPELGLDRGTIFAELDKPFIGEEAVPRDTRF